ncbi:MAG: hypothetical protein QNJ29_08740 [Rhizobiaceae bacterium]|nr:hypothetical protein [Rhizobiaceae bacterium]
MSNLSSFKRPIIGFNPKYALVLLTTLWCLGHTTPPASANNLNSFVEQAIYTCSVVAIARAGFDTLKLSDWYLNSSDKKDNGKAGTQVSYELLHTKVPWFEMYISASGIDSTYGTSIRTCSVSYNGVRHSFDKEKRLAWMNLSPEEISKEFQDQLHGLAKQLAVQKFAHYRPALLTDEKEVALKKCVDGIRYDANLILHRPKDNRVDAFFSLVSTDWAKPC